MNVDGAVPRGLFGDEEDEEEVDAEADEDAEEDVVVETPRLSSTAKGKGRGVAKVSSRFILV